MQNLKKGCVFGHIINFGKDMTDKLKKNACKNAYLGSIFIHEKYVFRVCFESPFTRMISSLKYKWPPGQIIQLSAAQLLLFKTLAKVYILGINLGITEKQVNFVGQFIFANLAEGLNLQNQIAAKL